MGLHGHSQTGCANSLQNINTYLETMKKRRYNNGKSYYSRNNNTRWIHGRQSNKTNTIEEGEIPYGGMLKVPIYLMTHKAHEPVEKDGITYRFVVNDMKQAVEAAKASAGDKSVALLGGNISRQCLKLGLVDEIVLAVVPLLLGDGISLFGGLGERIKLERIETSAFASETHLRYRVVK